MSVCIFLTLRFGWLALSLLFGPLATAFILFAPPKVARNLNYQAMPINMPPVYPPYTPYPSHAMPSPAYSPVPVNHTTSS